MNILAIESSTPSCSVALWVGNGVVAAREMLAKDVPSRQYVGLFSQSLPITATLAAKNSDVLLGEIRTLLASAGVSMRQLDAIAFGAGPGAFTGVRVACGVAQGMAMGCDIPVLPIGNLLALAGQHMAQQPVSVLSVLDARMGEAYIAGYRIAASGVDATEIIAPQLIVNIVAGTSAWPANMFDTAWHVMGSGGHLLPPEFAATAISKNATVIPHAIEIAMLGAAAFTRGEAIDCAYAIPLYLRNNVAQTIEERRKSGVSKALAAGILA